MDSVLVRSWEEYIPEVVVFQISKVKLRDNVASLGLESYLDGYLNSDEKIAQKWTESVVLDSNDEMVVSACAYFVAQNLITEEQCVELLNNSMSEYQV